MIKRCRVVVEFDLYDDSVEPKEVPSIIEEAVEKTGYCLSSSELIEVKEVEE